MKLGYIIVYVKDVPATLNFYVTTFGCTIRFLNESKFYGELNTGSTVLAFCDESWAHNSIGSFTHNRPATTPAGFEIGFVSDDVARDYEHALAQGATAHKAPEVKPWGQTVAYVIDLNGVYVEICSAIPA